MANPLLTPDGKHPQLGESYPRGANQPITGNDDFETCPQPFGRTLKATTDGGQSYVWPEEAYDSDAS